MVRKPTLGFVARISNVRLIQRRKPVNQDESPFASFQPSTDAPVAPPEKPAKNRKAKKPARQVTGVALNNPGPGGQTTAKVKTVPIKTRKKRVKKDPDAVRTLKVDPLLVMGACVGLSSDVVPVVARIMQALQKLPKKSRQRVIVALGKIFS
jgi:hypothetical protein